MDWTQCLTIIGTTLGATSVLFFITRKDMQLMDERMTKSLNIMEKHHREDIKEMDSKWAEILKFIIKKD